MSLVAEGNQESVGAELDVVIMDEFIPMSSTGRASTTNSISMLTVLLMMLVTGAAGRRLISLE